MVGNLYDFHSHILPGMDDGYPDTESAIQALKLSYAQGVRYIVATPHYYCEEPVERFLRRRNDAMARLTDAMEKDGGPFPEICPGAEVAYYPNISFSEELRRLCIGNSDYLLLELPVRTWGIEVFRDVRSICNAGEITPILAHIDRYIPIQSKEMMAQMLRLELRLQLGAESVLERRSRRVAKKLIRENPAILLGSDCHNLEDRPPNMGDAVDLLCKKRLAYVVAHSMALSKEIWNEAVG